MSMSILDDLRTAIQQTKPILYYTTGEHVTRGKTYRIGPIDIWPEVWHFHPDDFICYAAELSQYCRLVDFRLWTPSQEDVVKAADARLAELIKQPVAFRG